MNGLPVVTYRIDSAEGRSLRAIDFTRLMKAERDAARDLFTWARLAVVVNARPGDYSYERLRHFSQQHTQAEEALIAFHAACESQTQTKQE